MSYSFFRNLTQPAPFLSIKNWILIIIIALFYYFSGRLGQIFALPPGYHITPVWPPSGIALAAVLLFGYRILPGIWLGSFFNNFLLFIEPLDSEYVLNAFITSTGIGIGASLQAYVGGYFIRKYADAEPLSSQVNVVKFIIIGILSCLVNSNIGILSLSLAQPINWTETWWTWWIGDAAGVLIFTSFILSWSTIQIKNFSVWKAAEALFIAVCLLLFAKMVITSSFDLTYTLIPLVIWAGFRFYQKGVTLAIVFISAFTIWQTIQGYGPFFVKNSLNQSLLLLELFFVVLTSTALLFVAALTERRNVIKLLEEYNLGLENKVSERTAELQQQLEQIKKMQEQIIIQEKLASLGTLTAGLAHEIKNPLNFIINFSELSLDLTKQISTDMDSQKDKIEAEKLSEIEEALNYLQLNISKSLEHAKRANYTVQDMLLHARNSPGSFQETDLNAIIREYSNLTFHSRKQKNAELNVKIETELDLSLPRILINRQNISRVILNILDNAFDSLEERNKILECSYQPKITITTKDLPNYEEIIISDNGLGISPEIRDKIFVPFFTQKASGHGTGLGLSISHDIVVQEHGGTLTCESKEGEYASFIIHLPKFSTPNRPVDESIKNS